MVSVSVLLLLLCAALPTLAEKYYYQTKYIDVPDFQQDIFKEDYIYEIPKPFRGPQEKAFKKSILQKAGHLITLAVDHFSFTNNATFKLRYLMNDTHWHQHAGKPIFFYTGNEGDIEMFAQNTGFMFEIAPDFNALLVFAEHRYYGKSMPFGDKSYNSTQYLGYLSSEQALADYAWLIDYLQQHQDRPSPVIAFGGSYGGMLSAYFRMKYPHVVTGAIAASAPIFQFTGLTPCEAFNRIVTADYQIASAECAASIRKSWSHINNLTASDAGKKWLTSTWKLCKPLNKTEDVKALKNWLINAYTNLAMINYPYPTNFLAPVPANPISAMCAQLPNSSFSDKVLLKSLFKAVTVYFNYTGSTKCLDTGTQATSNLGDLGWDFQSCTEMVMPMCADGHNDMFEPQPWNFAQYSDDCYKRWKVRPVERRPIMMYGGKDISTATNIVFSNGLLDPWSSGGVLRNISKSTVAIIIPEGAHHLDLRGSNPDDPISVIKARKYHRMSIRSWIRSYHEAKNNTTNY